MKQIKNQLNLLLPSALSSHDSSSMDELLCQIRLDTHVTPKGNLKNVHITTKDNISHLNYISYRNTRSICPSWQPLHAQQPKS